MILKTRASPESIRSERGNATMNFVRSKKVINVQTERPPDK